jgi:uncharacterized repeat protein (TIGR01451 family)
MRTLRLSISLAATALLVGIPLAHAQQAKGSLELKAVAQKEVRVVDANGAEKIERVAAGLVTPGEDVIYVITATNVSDETTEHVVITDPIPESMTYREGTATGAAQVTFSVDRGTSYGVPDSLRVVDANGKPERAGPEDYTHIRWRLDEPLRPGESQLVEFRARLD